MVYALVRREKGEPSDIDERQLESMDSSRDLRTSNLAVALRAGQLTLVCGAGVSVGAGVPNWHDLLLGLLGSVVERISKDNSMALGEEAASEFSRRHASSTLILGKYLKNSLGADFKKMVRDALYRNRPTTCDLIELIVDISRPRRDGRPLESIITFNFDDLLERNMSSNRISACPIYSEHRRYGVSDLPIYHVHGYLPRSARVDDLEEIVFSEDSYHSQFIDPFSWSNIVQLNKYSQNTCLFVGISLEDPNLRRLLDVAWRKNPDKILNHYVIKKRPVSSSGNDVDYLALLLEEQDANHLGINVIWVDEYLDIPDIIRSI